MRLCRASACRARARQRERRDDPDGPVPALDPRAETPPNAARLFAVHRFRRRARDKGQNARRPPMSRRPGRRVSIAAAAMETPIAPTGPSPAVEFTEASVRHRSAATTVPAEASMAGPAGRRDPHRLVLVLPTQELFPVAGGQEERVVGTGSEDEHQQDATGLTVDDDAGLGEPDPRPRTAPSARSTAKSGSTQKSGCGR